MGQRHKELKIAIIGLGYVGLPLILAFAIKRKVIGFDTNKTRVSELKSGIDKNKEFSKKDIQKTSSILFTDNPSDLENVNFYIITVPTPVDFLKKPDLSYLKKASAMVGKFLKKEDIVVYESTVFPGCIEEECVPILEKFSNLTFNDEFFCGYSPERINPGDKIHKLENIKKITSGSTNKSADLIDELYKEIITAGTHRAPSIKVAEAAKVIENTQRDLNIALINELSILFNKMNIDTQEVLNAASTKWNFLSFNPGLVGGHCIGVDPYYLTYKANTIGFNPKVILAGRETNDNMGVHIAATFFSKMKKKNIRVQGSKVLIMGLTFKENCADIRNSGVEGVIKELTKSNCKIDLYDPWVNNEEIFENYNIYPKQSLLVNSYDGIIIAVAHDEFKKMGIKAISELCKEKSIIYDLKYLFQKDEVDLRL